MSTIMVDDKSAVPHHYRLSMDPNMTMLFCIAESEIKVIHTYIPNRPILAGRELARQSRFSSHQLRLRLRNINLTFESYNTASCY